MWCMTRPVLRCCDVTTMSWRGFSVCLLFPASHSLSACNYHNYDGVYARAAERKLRAKRNAIKIGNDFTRVTKVWCARGIGRPKALIMKWNFANAAAASTTMCQRPTTMPIRRFGQRLGIYVYLFYLLVTRPSPKPHARPSCTEHVRLSHCVYRMDGIVSLFLSLFYLCHFLCGPTFFIAPKSICEKIHTIFWLHHAHHLLHSITRFGP